MEDDDDDDGSSALTHGSKVAFQGSPLKALMARRRQRPADAVRAGVLPLFSRRPASPFPTRTPSHVAAHCLC